MRSENPPFGLSEARVAIIGLGLMGGSLALALRGKCRTCLGLDPDPETIDLARKRQIVDRASPEPDEILPEANVLVLAAPINAILDWIARLPALKPDSAVILDLGSAKVPICQALETLPSRFDPLGGHPMAGKEKSGLAQAEAALYQNAIFALTPLPNTTPRARSIALEIIEVIGAAPLWLNPDTHDAYVAATSHMPYLISAALALGTPPEVASLIGPGFRSTARLAGSGPRMMTEILLSNREAVLGALSRFQQQLNRLEGALKRGDPEALQHALRQVQHHRKVLLDRNKAF